MKAANYGEGPPKSSARSYFTQFAFPGERMRYDLVQIRVLRLPWKTLHDRPIIGNKRIRVAGATTLHAEFEHPIGAAVDRIQQFQHGKAATIAAIERWEQSRVGQRVTGSV